MANLALATLNLKPGAFNLRGGDMNNGMARYEINPRFVPDDLPLWLGSDKDSALVYRASPGELALQTRDAGGALINRARLAANTDMPIAYLHPATVFGPASAPAPDSQVHVWLSSAGTAAADADAALTIEKNDNVALQFLTPNNKSARLYFGDPQSAFAGWIQYEHNTNRFSLGINAAERLRYSAGSFAFQEATQLDLLGGEVLLTERSDPNAPAANKAALYARDNGSGKTQLVVRFNTGAVQVLATEP